MNLPPPPDRPRRAASVIRITSRQAERGIRRLLHDLSWLDEPERPGARSLDRAPRHPGEVDADPLAPGPPAAGDGGPHGATVVDLDEFRRARRVERPVPPGEAV